MRHRNSNCVKRAMMMVEETNVAQFLFGDAMPSISPWSVTSVFADSEGKEPGRPGAGEHEHFTLFAVRQHSRPSQGGGGRGLEMTFP